MGEGGVGCADVVEEVADRPGNTVAFGLPGDEGGIVRLNDFEQFIAACSQGLTLCSLRDFGANGGIGFCERVLAFEDEIGRAIPGDAVEKQGLLN